jgi:hypothetical protein
MSTQDARRLFDLRADEGNALFGEADDIYLDVEAVADSEFGNDSAQ